MIGITGANGFLGNALVQELTKLGRKNVVPIVRRRTGIPHERASGYIGSNTHWNAVLEGLSTVVHCAAQAHVTKSESLRRAHEFHVVNTEGTLCLARAAATSGVKRFVFLSSVKVMGESTELGNPFTLNDSPNPKDAYGASKLAAERGLKDISYATGMEVVIIRPPLVYGPAVRANFRLLMKWVASGTPMPLAAIQNKRSMVALPNLVDLVTTCIDHPAAAGETFFVSDAHDLSTPELIDAISQAMGRSSTSFKFPLPALNLIALLLKRSDALSRLTQSLQVDISRTQEILNWAPIVSVDEGMRMTVKDFLCK